MTVPDQCSDYTQSCSTNVGITVGVTTFAAFAAGVATTVLILLCWLRYVKQWIPIA